MIFIRYLNDLYVLELKNSGYQWDMPNCTGEPPTPRESHTAVTFTPRSGPGPKLLIYGGMSGFRLGDICILDIPSMTWSKIDPSGKPKLFSIKKTEIPISIRINTISTIVAYGYSN